jgi:hypothetical protein
MTDPGDEQLALFGDHSRIIIEAKKETADRRRTAQQYARITAGIHPFSGLIAGRYLRLHPEAAPDDDTKAPGRRCGNCRFRTVFGHRNRSYGKCTYPTGAPNAPRVTHSAASDCRAWWPGCVDHQPEETDQ